MGIYDHLSVHILVHRKVLYMKLRTVFQKFRHLFILGAVLFAAVCCMAWVGYDTVRESVGLGHRQIVNDDYSTLTPSIDGVGITQPITVDAGTDFYGVNLNMHTYNRVVFGTIFVELQDADGNVLAVCQDDMTNIKDNTFMRFVFGGQNFKNDETKDYLLRVYTQPQTENDLVAMWKSETTVEGWKNLSENGTEAQGTLALQYIVKYVTSAIWSWYLVLCGLILALLTGAYLLIFVKKVKVSTAFVFIAAVTGIIFSIYTPVRGAPDEYTHITSSYSQSNSLLGYKYGGYYEGYMLVRESDVDNYTNPVNYNAFELHDLWENFDKTGKEDTMVYVKGWKAEVFPALYWAQTVGLHLARMLGVSFSMLIVMGRLSNLLLYIALCWLAIRKMPVYKTTMAAVALTPVPLQLAASFNYDPLVIGLCFLFTATVFSLAYEKQQVTNKDIAILAVLAAFIAPSKTVYVLITALCLIIPKEKFGSSKKALISFGVILAAAAVMWVGYNKNVIGMLIPQAPAETQQEVVLSEEDIEQQNIKDQYAQSVGAEFIEVESESDKIDSDAQEVIEGTDVMLSGDSVNYFTPYYILTHIPQTVKLIINTVQENAELYIRQIFGGILGEVIVSPVKVNWLYVIGIIAVMFMTTLLPQGQTLVYSGVKKWWCFAVAMAVVMLVCAAGVIWTPANYTTAFGIQGRYMIPVLPLIVMLFANDNITLKKSIDGSLLYALCGLDVLIILDGLTIMLANTKVYY